MGTTAVLEPLSDTIALVPDDETTGQRVRRERRDLGLTQAQLAELANVSESTVYLIERDKPARRGLRLSVDDVLAALERERAKRESETVSPPGKPTLHLVSEILAHPSVHDARMRRIGRHEGIRYLSVVVVDDPKVTDRQIAEAIEELHRGGSDQDDTDEGDES